MKRWSVKNDGTVETNEPFELPTYLEMFIESPWRAVKEIAACAFILALMFGAFFLKDILMWVERSLP